MEREEKPHPHHHLYGGYYGDEQKLVKRVRRKWRRGVQMFKDSLTSSLWGGFRICTIIRSSLSGESLLQVLKSTLASVFTIVCVHIILAMVSRGSVSVNTQLFLIYASMFLIAEALYLFVLEFFRNN